MKYKFTYRFFSMAFCLLTVGIACNAAPALAKAPPPAIPKDIQGNWSLPDCRRQEQVMVFGDGYILKIMPEYVSLYEAALTGGGEGYYIIRINDSDEIAVSLSNDGIMDVGYPPQDTNIPPKKTWDDLEMDHSEEYSHCIEILSARHQPGFGAMAHLTEVLGACSDPSSATCGHTLFAVADTDNDKKLTSEEMLRAGLMLVYITEAAESQSVPIATLENATTQARREISFIVKELMTRNDRDKSKTLTRAELGNPLDIVATTPSAAYFFTVMTKAKNLFPWFGSILHDGAPAR